MKKYYDTRIDGELAFLDVEKIDEKTFSIANFIVPHEFRGKGVGSKLLNEAISDADKECVTLTLTARPYATDNKEELEKLKSFYEKFGFERKRGSNIMIRESNCNLYKL